MADEIKMVDEIKIEKSNNDIDTNANPLPAPIQAGIDQASLNKLRSLVERIERLEDEKQAITEDVRDIYSEANSEGFEAKIIRKLIALRKLDPDKRRDEENKLQLYMSVLGME